MKIFATALFVAAASLAAVSCQEKETSFAGPRNPREFKTDAELRDAVHWSSSTNGVQCGLLVLRLQDDPRDYVLTLALHGTSRDRTIVWFPPESQRFAIELSAPNGDKVARTAKGRTLGDEMKRTSNNLKSQGYQVRWVHQDDVTTVIPRIRLSDWFDIPNSGGLVLRGEIRALVVHGDDLLPTTFVIPPILLNGPEG